METLRLIATHQLKDEARLGVFSDNVDEEERAETLLIGWREFEGVTNFYGVKEEERSNNFPKSLVNEVETESLVGRKENAQENMVTP